MINETIHEALRVKEKIKSRIDYCTGVPDFEFIRDFCKQHDNDYDNQIGKFKADWNFFTGSLKSAVSLPKVIKRVEAVGVSIVYYLGVSIGGWFNYWKAGKK